MLVLVKAEGTTDSVLAGQGLAGAIHGEEQVGAPAAGMRKAGVKVGDREVEKIAEEGLPDGLAEEDKEAMEFDRGRLAVQLQDEGNNATKGQRTAANEVPVELLDVLRALCLGRIREGAQQCQIAMEGVGHYSKTGSRLMR